MRKNNKDSDCLVSPEAEKILKEYLDRSTADFEFLVDLFKDQKVFRKLKNVVFHDHPYSQERLRFKKWKNITNNYRIRQWLSTGEVDPKMITRLSEEALIEKISRLQSTVLPSYVSSGVLNHDEDRPVTIPELCVVQSNFLMVTVYSPFVDISQTKQIFSSDSEHYLLQQNQWKKEKSYKNFAVKLSIYNGGTSVRQIKGKNEGNENFKELVFYCTDKSEVVELVKILNLAIYFFKTLVVMKWKSETSPDDLLNKSSFYQKLDLPSYRVLRWNRFSGFPMSANPVLDAKLPLKYDAKDQYHKIELSICACVRMACQYYMDTAPIPKKEGEKLSKYGVVKYRTGKLGYQTRKGEVDQIIQLDTDLVVTYRNNNLSPSDQLAPFWLLGLNRLSPFSQKFWDQWINNKQGEMKEDSEYLSHHEDPEFRAFPCQEDDMSKSEFSHFLGLIMNHLSGLFFSDYVSYSMRNLKDNEPRLRLMWFQRFMDYSRAPRTLNLVRGRDRGEQIVFAPAVLILRYASVIPTSGAAGMGEIYSGVLKGMINPFGSGSFTILIAGLSAGTSPSKTEAKARAEKFDEYIGSRKALRDHYETNNATSDKHIYNHKGEDLLAMPNAISHTEDWIGMGKLAHWLINNWIPEEKKFLHDFKPEVEANVEYKQEEFKEKSTQKFQPHLSFNELYHASTWTPPKEIIPTTQEKPKIKVETVEDAVVSGLTRKQKENKIAGKLPPQNKKGRGDKRVIMLTGNMAKVLGRDQYDSQKMVDFTDEEIDKLYNLLFQKRVPAETLIEPVVEIVKKKEEIPDGYTYGLSLRPMYSGMWKPQGFESVLHYSPTPVPHAQQETRHGVVVTPTPLSGEFLSHQTIYQYLPLEEAIEKALSRFLTSPEEFAQYPYIQERWEKKTPAQFKDLQVRRVAQKTKDEGRRESVVRYLYTDVPVGELIDKTAERYIEKVIEILKKKPKKKDFEVPAETLIEPVVEIVKKKDRVYSDPHEYFDYRGDRFTVKIGDSTPKKIPVTSRVQYRVLDKEQFQKNIAAILNLFAMMSAGRGVTLMPKPSIGYYEPTHPNKMDARQLRENLKQLNEAGRNIRKMLDDPSNSRYKSQILKMIDVNLKSKVNFNDFVPYRGHNELILGEVTTVEEFVGDHKGYAVFVGGEDVYAIARIPVQSAPKQKQEGLPTQRKKDFDINIEYNEKRKKQLIKEIWRATNKDYKGNLNDPKGTFISVGTTIGKQMGYGSGFTRINLSTMELSELEKLHALKLPKKEEGKEPETLSGKEKYTGSLAKGIKTFKKTLKIKTIRQGYKGTHAQKAQRQMFMRFEKEEGVEKSFVDLWLMNDGFTFDQASLNIANKSKYATQFSSASMEYEWDLVKDLQNIYDHIFMLKELFGYPVEGKQEKVEEKHDKPKISIGDLVLISDHSRSSGNNEVGIVINVDPDILISDPFTRGGLPILRKRDQLTRLAGKDEWGEEEGGHFYALRSRSPLDYGIDRKNIIYWYQKPLPLHKVDTKHGIVITRKPLSSDFLKNTGIKRILPPKAAIQQILDNREQVISPAEFAGRKKGTNFSPVVQYQKKGKKKFLEFTKGRLSNQFRTPVYDSGVLTLSLTMQELLDQAVEEYANQVVAEIVQILLDGKEKPQDNTRIAGKWVEYFFDKRVKPFPLSNVSPSQQPDELTSQMLKWARDKWKEENVWRNQKKIDFNSKVGLTGVIGQAPTPSEALKLYTSNRNNGVVRVDFPLVLSEKDQHDPEILFQPSRILVQTARILSHLDLLKEYGLSIPYEGKDDNNVFIAKITLNISFMYLPEIDRDGRSKKKIDLMLTIFLLPYEAVYSVARYTTGGWKNIFKSSTRDMTVLDVMDNRKDDYGMSAFQVIWKDIKKHTKPKLKKIIEQIKDDWIEEGFNKYIAVPKEETFGGTTVTRYRGMDNDLRKYILGLGYQPIPTYSDNIKMRKKYVEYGLFEVGSDKRVTGSKLGVRIEPRQKNGSLVFAVYGKSPSVSEYTERFIVNQRTESRLDALKKFRKVLHDVAEKAGIKEYKLPESDSNELKIKAQVGFIMSDVKKQIESMDTALSRKKKKQGRLETRNDTVLKLRKQVDSWNWDITGQVWLDIYPQDTEQGRILRRTSSTRVLKKEQEAKRRLNSILKQVVDGFLGQKQSEIRNQINELSKEIADLKSKKKKLQSMGDVTIQPWVTAIPKTKIAASLSANLPLIGNYHYFLQHTEVIREENKLIIRFPNKYKNITTITAKVILDDSNRKSVFVESDWGESTGVLDEEQTDSKLPIVKNDIRDIEHLTLLGMATILSQHAVKEAIQEAFKSPVAETTINEDEDELKPTGKEPETVVISPPKTSIKPEVAKISENTPSVVVNKAELTTKALAFLKKQGLSVNGEEFSRSTRSWANRSQQ